MLRPSEDVIIPSANFAVSVFFESALPRLNLLHDKCIKGTCQESSRYWEFAVSVENWEQGKEQEERWSFWHFKAQQGPRSEEYNLVVELVTKISCLEFDGHVINTLFRTRYEYSANLSQNLLSAVFHAMTTQGGNLNPWVSISGKKRNQQTVLDKLNLMTSYVYERPAIGQLWKWQG